MPLGTVTLAADLPAKNQSYGLFKANAGLTRMEFGVQYRYISISIYIKHLGI